MLTWPSHISVAICVFKVGFFNLSFFFFSVFFFFFLTAGRPAILWEGERKKNPPCKTDKQADRI